MEVLKEPEILSLDNISESDWGELSDIISGNVKEVSLTIIDSTYTNFEDYQKTEFETLKELVELFNEVKFNMIDKVAKKFNETFARTESLNLKENFISKYLKIYDLNKLSLENKTKKSIITSIKDKFSKSRNIRIWSEYNETIFSWIDFKEQYDDFVIELNKVWIYGLNARVISYIFINNKNSADWNPYFESNIEKIIFNLKEVQI